MTLVFASLGVPIERATVIALSFRGLTFWLPLAIGFVLLRRLKTFKTGRICQHRGMEHPPGCHPDCGDGHHRCAVGLTPALHNRLVLLEQYSPIWCGCGWPPHIRTGRFRLTDPRQWLVEAQAPGVGADRDHFDHLGARAPVQRIGLRRGNPGERRWRPG